MKSSGLPAPPEAMTGMCVARETARVKGQSKPSWTPSVSMEVRRISPAPRASPRAAHCDGVDAFVVAPAARVDVPCAGGAAARVDGQHHRLRSEFVAQFGEELGAAHGGGIDGNLIGAGHEDAAGIGDGADAAPDGERDENLARGAGDDVGHDLARVARGRDVEEDEFVGPLAVIAVGELDRVAGVTQVDEVDALDDPAAGDVQAGNDALGEHEIPV